jgi:hypothetical protein
MLFGAALVEEPDPQAAFWGLKRPQTEEPAHAKFELSRTATSARCRTSASTTPA